MISRNLSPLLNKIAQTEISKLEDPLNKLSDVRHSIVFIYPAIITDSIGGTDEEKLLRKFYAASLLKEIDITNIITSIEDILKVNDKLLKQKQSSINFNLNEPTTKVLSSYLAHQMTSEELKSVKSNSQSLYSKLKQIIENDPYYQQYQAVVAYKDINGIKIPLVIGTKNYQVNDYALALVLTVAIIENKRLDNLRDIAYLERIFKTKAIEELLIYYNSENDSESFINNVKRYLSKVKLYASNKAKRIISSVASYLSFLKKSQSTQTSTNYTLPEFYNKYLKLTASDIEQVFTILKLVTNIHYYSSQLNDRFSDYVVQSYTHFANNEFKQNIIKFLKTLVQYSTNNLDLENPDAQEFIHLLNDIAARIDNLNLYNLPDNEREKLVDFILEHITDLEDLSERLNCDEIPTITLDEIDRALKYTIKQFVAELSSNIDNAKASEEYEDEFDFTPILKIIDQLRFGTSKNPKLPKINVKENEVLKQIIDYSKYTPKDFTMSKKYQLSQDQLESIFKDLKASFLSNSVAGKIIRFNLNKFLDVLNDLFVKIYTHYDQYIESILSTTLVQYIKDQEIVNTIISKAKKKITELSTQITRGVIGYIILKTICFYIDNFLKYLTIKSYTIDENNLTKTLKFPNYLLILPEQLINFISSITITRKPEILTNIDFIDIEPKKILNPLSTSNIKYNTEYIIRKLNIPSIMVLTANRKSVIYKLPFMRKPEKTSLENIQKFIELYSVLVK